MFVNVHWEDMFAQQCVSTFGLNFPLELTLILLLLFLIPSGIRPKAYCILPQSSPTAARRKPELFSTCVGEPLTGVCVSFVTNPPHVKQKRSLYFFIPTTGGGKTN